MTLAKYSYEPLEMFHGSRLAFTDDNQDASQLTNSYQIQRALAAG